jgi:hypothetical protein
MAGPHGYHHEQDDGKNSTRNEEYHQACENGAQVLGLGS